MANAEGGSVDLQVLDFPGVGIGLGSTCKLALAQYACDQVPVLDRGYIALILNLPKPWLVSLIKDFSDSSMRLALFGTCRGLSQLVVEHCSTLHLWPAVAELEQHPEYCADLSRLATGCNEIRLGLRGGSIPITPDVARSVTELTLIDTHLHIATISCLCMHEMHRLQKITLSCEDKNHRHSAQLMAHTLFTALPTSCSAAVPSYHVVHLKIASADADDVYNTLQCLHPALGNSLLTLETCQVSAVKALGLYEKLTALKIDDTDDDQLLAHEEQLQLITHPTLRNVSLPGCVWPSDGLAHSSHVWPLATLELTDFGGLSSALATLPLQGVKRLMIEGGFNARDGMYEEMLVNLQRCCDVVFVPSYGYHVYTAHGVPEDLPVLEIDACLDPEVMQFVMQRYTGTCLWLSKNHLQLHHLEGLAHIPAHVTTLVLASWRPDCDEDCTWVEVWRHLPVHISHVVLAQVFIDWDEMLAIFDEPPRPALQQVTLAFRPGSKSTGWVLDAAEELTAMANSKWGVSVCFVFKMVHVSLNLNGDDDDLAEEVAEDEAAEHWPADVPGPQDAPAVIPGPEQAVADPFQAAFELYDGPAWFPGPGHAVADPLQAAFELYDGPAWFPGPQHAVADSAQAGPEHVLGAVVGPVWRHGPEHAVVPPVQPAIWGAVGSAPAPAAGLVGALAGGSAAGPSAGPAAALQPGPGTIDGWVGGTVVGLDDGLQQALLRLGLCLISELAL